MNLKYTIENSHKDIVGSRTENRLSIQVSYAIQLIMEYYRLDYIVLMDYIEDVAVITDIDGDNGGISIYQVKSKTADQAYRFSTVVEKKWFEKLYMNALKYNAYLTKAAVVCNTEIIDSNRQLVFPNEKSSLKEFENNENIKKIKAAIAKDQKITESEVDLSQFYFIHSTFTVKNHMKEIEHKFSDFLFDMNENIQVATVKTIFNELYRRLELKFRNEINNDCTDIKEIISQKGLNQKEVQSIVNTGLLVQLPTTEALYDKFDVVKPLDIRNYNSAFSQIKMDIFSNKSIFNEFKDQISAIVKNTLVDDLDSLKDVLELSYVQVKKETIIPVAYDNEYYIKLLTMLTIYKQCYGGI